MQMFLMKSLWSTLLYHPVILVVSSIFDNIFLLLFISSNFSLTSLVFSLLKNVLIFVSSLFLKISIFSVLMIKSNVNTSVLDRCVLVVAGTAVIRYHPFLHYLLVIYLIDSFGVVLKNWLLKYFLCCLMMLFSKSYTLMYVFYFLFIVVSYKVFIQYFLQMIQKLFGILFAHVIT